MNVPGKSNETDAGEMELTMTDKPATSSGGHGNVSAEHSRHGKREHSFRAGRKLTSTELVLDLRTWIAAMFATFGVMLAVYGTFFATPEDIAKGAGINLNLWTGVGLIVVAVLFALWLLVRPSGVDENVVPAQ